MPNIKLRYKPPQYDKAVVVSKELFEKIISKEYSYWKAGTFGIES